MRCSPCKCTRPVITTLIPGILVTSVQSLVLTGARRWRIVPQCVPALAYHKVADIPLTARHRCNYVTPAQFASQLAYLRAARFTPISFAQYLAYRRGDGDLPRRPI